MSVNAPSPPDLRQVPLCESRRLARTVAHRAVTDHVVLSSITNIDRGAVENSIADVSPRIYLMHPPTRRARLPALIRLFAICSGGDVVVRMGSLPSLIIGMVVACRIGVNLISLGRLWLALTRSPGSSTCWIRQPGDLRSRRFFWPVRSQSEKFPSPSNEAIYGDRAGCKCFRPRR